MKSFLGIDIGGLRIKTAIVREGDDGEIVHRAGVTCDVQPEDRAVEAMVKRIAHLASGCDEKIDAIGLGVAGAVRSASGVVAKASNYEGWEGADLGRAVGEAASLPVTVDNDANLFALAETRLGAAKGKTSVLALTLGTGLGGGVVLGGRLHRGARGFAGEAGHVVLREDGVPCGCGARGCVEQYASTKFLAREGRARLPGILQGVPDREVGSRLAQAARNGDDVARTLFAEFGSHLGCAVAGIVNVLDVEAVVVGGGLAAASDLFLQATARELELRAFAAIDNDLELLVAKIGDIAGAVGAGLAAMDGTHS